MVRVDSCIFSLIAVSCIGCARQHLVLSLSKNPVSDYGCTRNLRHIQHPHCLTLLMYLLDSRSKLYNIRSGNVEPVGVRNKLVVGMLELWV